MVIDWRTKPWWLRPLYMCARGVVIGFGLVFAVDHLLPPSIQPWAYGAFALAVVVWCVYLMVDLNRSRRDLDQRLLEFQRLMAQEEPRRERD